MSFEDAQQRTNAAVRQWLAEMSDQCGLCRRPLADHVSEDGSEGACRYADAPEDRAFLTDPWGLDR